MIKVFNIVARTFCLLLMMHLLAVSICNNYLLKLTNSSNIEQPLDEEKDTDNFSKNKSCEFDDCCEEYLADSFNNFNYHHSFHRQVSISTVSFQYLQIALPQSINEILIPPPLT